MRGQIQTKTASINRQADGLRVMDAVVRMVWKDLSGVPSLARRLCQG